MSMFLSLGIVVSMSAQKFNVVSGSPVQYRAKGGYHITFVSQDLVIGKFPSEQSYVDYMIEQCNAIKPDSGAVWAHEWQSATNELYKPKFMTLFNKHSLMGHGYISPGDHKYQLEVDTRYINPGGQMVNGRKSPARLEVQVTIRHATGDIEPLVLEITKIKGVETAMPHTPMSDVQRISQGYAKCAKELAKYLSKW